MNNKLFFVVWGDLHPGIHRHLENGASINIVEASVKKFLQIRVFTCWHPTGGIDRDRTVKDGCFGRKLVRCASVFSTQWKCENCGATNWDFRYHVREKQQRKKNSICPQCQRVFQLRKSPTRLEEFQLRKFLTQHRLFLETGNLSHAPVKIVETEVYYAIESSRDRKTVSYATESSETIVSYAIESSRDRKTVSYAIESSRDGSLLRHWEFPRRKSPTPLRVPETGRLSPTPLRVPETEVSYAIESSRDKKTVSYATDSSLDEGADFPETVRVTRSNRERHFVQRMENTTTATPRKPSCSVCILYCACSDLVYLCIGTITHSHNFCKWER